MENITEGTGNAPVYHMPYFLFVSETDTGPLRNVHVNNVWRDNSAKLGLRNDEGGDRKPLRHGDTLEFSSRHFTLDLYASHSFLHSFIQAVFDGHSRRTPHFTRNLATIFRSLSDLLNGAREMKG